MWETAKYKIKKPPCSDERGGFLRYQPAPFERCAATARRVKHAVVHHLPGIKQSRKPQSKGWGFLLCGKRQRAKQKSPLALTSEGASCVIAYGRTRAVVKPLDHKLDGVF
jgi:hypothetical protein